MNKLNNILISGEIKNNVKPKKYAKMKEISQVEIREIAENIVRKTNGFDAVEDVSEILKEMLRKMNIAVEEIKNNPNCKCTNCKCVK